MKYADDYNERYKGCMLKGAEFYKTEQFRHNGRSLWRLPARYPTDIHNQSVGIFTFSEICNYNEEYISFAETIAKWTIRNMQDKDGFFYYRKGRIITNRIPYMRWSQAWMFLALVTLTETKNRIGKND